ncbi:MAG: universal stress protein [Chloroflexi bacterium]|nr:universal stress protein [Chloroflexota bacterium]
MQKTLLAPLDGSEASEASLPWAIKLAQDRALGIVLVRVVEYPQLATDTWGAGAISTDVYEEVLEIEREAAREYLDGVKHRLEAAGVAATVTVASGTPAVALLDLVDQLGAEAVVIASHGHSGLKRLVLGSVAHQLLAHATVPVFLVRADPPDQRRTPSFARIIVPLDGSALSERAVAAAQEIVAPGGTLLLVRVAPWPDPSLGEGGVGRVRDNEKAAYRVSLAREYLERIAGTVRARDVTVETQVIVSESKGSVAHHLAVTAATANVDAIVMSTHGRGGMTGWLLGSVADEVVRSVDRPVLAVSARAAASGVMGRQRVGDIMTRDVLALREDESLVVALRKLVRRHASGAPVLDANGAVTGVVSQRDILGWHERKVAELAEDRQPTSEHYLALLRTETVRSVMSSPAATIPETASVASALTMLRERSLHRLPVTREGQLVGIVTGSDILLALLAQLESADMEHHQQELEPTAAELAGAQAGR